MRDVTGSSKDATTVGLPGAIVVSIFSLICEMVGFGTHCSLFRHDRGADIQVRVHRELRSVLHDHAIDVHADVHVRELRVDQRDPPEPPVATGTRLPTLNVLFCPLFTSSEYLRPVFPPYRRYRES